MKVLISKDADTVEHCEDIKCKLHTRFLNDGFLLASNLTQLCRSCYYVKQYILSCEVLTQKQALNGVRSWARARSCSRIWCSVVRHPVCRDGAQPKYYGGSVWMQSTAASVFQQSFCTPKRIDAFGPPHKARLHLPWLIWNYFSPSLQNGLPLFGFVVFFWGQC